MNITPGTKDVRLANLHAVVTGEQEVNVYDDKVRPDELVYIESNLDAAVYFMEVVTDYLDACEAYQGRPNQTTEGRMSACFLSLPPYYQSTALSRAKARGLV